MKSKDNTVNIKVKEKVLPSQSISARAAAPARSRSSTIRILEAKPKSATMPRPEAKPKSAAMPRPEAKPKLETKPKPQTKPKPKPKPKPQTKPKPEAPKNYHHGDLRAALLEAGFRLLEDRNGETLGLREVAREVGVSPTAIYRHFSDKATLMLALAHEGLERLGTAQLRAAQKTVGGRAALVASGVTYVRFASENPALFRLIFSYVPPISPLDASLDEVGLAMRGLREGIHTTMPSHYTENEKKVATLMAWSLVHGLAELLLNGHIAKDWKMIETVVGSLSLAHEQHP
jgi:AcrR family transcriptional regulator